MEGSAVTLPTGEILRDKSARAFLVYGFLMKPLKKYPENMKKSWEPFGSYLLYSRQLLNVLV